MRIPAAAIRQGNIIPISSSLDPAQAALIEPFACVLRGQDAVDVHVGDNVLVVGAGPIGFMHALLARVRGASKVFVSEVLPERLAQARDIEVDRSHQSSGGRSGKGNRRRDHVGEVQT